MDPEGGELPGEVERADAQDARTDDAIGRRAAPPSVTGTWPARTRVYRVEVSGHTLVTGAGPDVLVAREGQRPAGGIVEVQPVQHVAGARPLVNEKVERAGLDRPPAAEHIGLST